MNNEGNFEKLENFINGIAAARVLLIRAYESEFLIEAIVLYAVLVDGFCRIALVLKEQIENKSPNFEVKYVHQNDDKNYYPERSIYKLAFERSILEKDLFDEIDALYEFRNKIIHRFLTTEIEYTHLGLVLGRYELAYQRLYNLVYGLESEQIHRGIGMTVVTGITKDDKKTALEGILKKVDSKNPEKLKQTMGSRLIKDAETFSERSEKEKISDEISDELEIRKEKMIIPPGFISVKEITKKIERNGFFQECVCGHGKIYHINMSETEKVLINKCNINKCKCEDYCEK